MTAVDIDLALLKARVERRGCERAIAAVSLIVFGIFVFRVAESVPGVSSWLAGASPESVPSLKLYLAILVCVAMYAIADLFAEPRERRLERALRESFISPLPIR